MSSSEFKKLQAKWYQKLKKSGFKDIEDTKSPNEMLHTWDSLYFLSRNTAEQFQAKERYFTLARQFLESHIFETSREKAIWSQWAEGLSIREIARRRRATPYKVGKVVKSLERLMLGTSKK